MTFEYNEYHLVIIVADITLINDPIASLAATARIGYNSMDIP